MYATEPQSRLITGLTIVTITDGSAKEFIKTSQNIDLDDNKIEWIVVNKSDQKLTSLRSPHLELTESGENIFDAMNIGLKNATRELIIFMNSGDCFFNREIPSQILDSYSREGWFWAVASSLRTDGSSWNPFTVNNTKLQFGTNSYCHQSTVYKTEFIRLLGGFDTSSLVSDWLLTLRLHQIVPPYRVNETWSIFSLGGTSSKLSLRYKFNEYMRLKKSYKTLAYPYALEFCLQFLSLLYNKRNFIAHAKK